MADRILTVGIETDLSGLDTRTAMDRFAALGRAAQESGKVLASGIDSAVKSGVASLAQLGRSYDEALLKASRATKGASGANDLFGRSGKDLMGTLSKLSLGYLSVTKAVDLFKQGLNVVSDFQRINASLRAVTDTNAEYAAAQKLLLTTSDQLGVSYEALAVSYKGLAASTNNTNLEGVATERIFLSVVRAGAALKLSNDDIKGSLLALQQMMSKGTVQAEELRGQLGERIPCAFRLMANALGVTQQELNKMLESGSVLAEDALPKLATELEKVYGAKAQSNVETMAGGWTRATDQLKLYIAEFSERNGIDSFFARIGNGIADNIKLIREGGKAARELPQWQRSMDTFRSFTPQHQESFLGKVAANIQNKESQLDRSTAQAPTEESLRREKTLEYEIKTLKGKYAVYRRIARDEREKLEKETKTASIVPGFDIDKAKARQAVLAKVIQNAAGEGKSAPTTILAEYNKLTAQIDKATDATKKHKERLRSGTNEHTYLDSAKEGAQQLEEIIANMLNSGQAIPDQLLKMLSVYRSQLKETKRDLADLVPVALKDLKPITPVSNGRAITKATPSFSSGIPAVDSLAQAGQYMQDINSRRAQIGAGLSGRAAEMKNFGGLDYYQKQIDTIAQKIQNDVLKGMTPSKNDLEAYNYMAKRLDSSSDALLKAVDPSAYIAQQIAQIQRDAAKIDLSKGLKLPEEDIDKLAKLVAEAKKIQNADDETTGKAIAHNIKTTPQKWSNVGAIGKNWAGVAQERLAQNSQSVIQDARDMTRAIQGVFTSAAPSAAEAMGSFVDGLIAGTSKISDLPGIVLGVVADMLQQLATALATSAAFMAFVPGLQGQALAQGAAALGLFGVSAVARSASTQKKQKAFANGNTAYGPVQAVFGEYPNAARDPEFTAPVSKGANLIGDRLMQMGFGGGGGELRVELKGSTLLLWYERAQKESRMKGGGRG